MARPFFFSKIIIDNLDFSKDIIEILLRAPDGLSIRKIVRHVYNAHNTFFETVDLEDVKREVSTFLASRSKSSKSLIVHTGVRGIYKLNLNTDEGKQLALQFTDEQPTEKPSDDNKDTNKELSLSFDF